MSSQNKDIAEQFEVACAAEDVDAIEALCDPALIVHNAPPDQQPGLAGFKDSFVENIGTFTDLQLSLHHVIGEGDVVATHWSLSGTHQKESMGVPATGRRAKVEGMNVYRFADGRITEMWTQLDLLGLKDQLTSPAD
jgi:steroid delta-isomerase-like uncharacterized protein